MGELARLIDAMPQVSGGSGAPWQHIDLELAGPTLAAVQRRPELALAAWLVLLERVSGAGRVGVVLDNAWLELDLPAIDSVGILLSRVMEHQDPKAAVPRASPAAEVEAAWLVAGPSPADLAAVNTSLILAAGLSLDWARLVLHWSTPPVDPVTGPLLAAAWHEVLSQLIRSRPSDALASIQAIDANALGRQMRALSAGPWSYERQRGPFSVTECFDRACVAGPQRRALAWPGGAFTYSELDQLSRRVAFALASAGVEPGRVVAVGMPRSAKGIAAILGVLRAGAAYMPVDLGHPSERLQFMFSDSRAQALLATGVGDEWLGLRCIDIERLPELPQGSWVGPRLEGEALAYVMYTSGSTGQPKGVEIPHRAIVRLVCGTEFMQLDRDVVMLHAAPLGFDASTLEVWGPLLNGGCCVVHDEAVPSGPGLAAAIRAHGVQAAWLTAALFNAVVDDDPRHLAGLRELLIGGEALSLDHVRRFHDAVPGTQLINGYGPTETTTFAATHRIDVPALEGAKSVPIGRPITRTSLYILNRRGQPVPAGLVGELFIGGLGVGRGYMARPELTAERFLPDSFAADGGTMYRTGDLVRLRPDDTVEFIGRADGQVKIRGFRIELGEIETALAAHESVKACAVVARRDPQRGTELVAYVVPNSSLAGEGIDPGMLRDHLARRLPEFMVPALWVRMTGLPITLNGKLDRRALPEPARERPEHLAQHYVGPRSGLEAEVAAAFAAALDIDRVGALDNFFELGGSSLLIMRVFSALRAAGHTQLNVAMLFADPTARGMARALAEAHPKVGTSPSDAPRAAASAGGRGHGPNEPVAIVGMAGRFPGARDVEAFWQLLDEGREAIRFFRPEELDASIPAALRDDAQYVAARGVIDDVDLFDAGFFGISPREAELMDPQQRVFLELAWECLERAGHVPEKTPAPIGVWCGMYNATYFQRHVLVHPEKVARLGEFQVMLANEKDYIATRTAHKLGLTGPAVSVHTACSTSLVAIAQAFDALRAGHCGLALAGGSSITCPPASGYLHQEGSMLSPDGHTRSFDAEAQGTVFSDGAAVVALKRLCDAIADGNTIHAVIRGVGINNDGADKASFTAPSVGGQAAVVASALEHAGVDARSVSYVEAHGTATPLGDPVEVAALTRAFRLHTSDRAFCAIGSLKSNTGHMVIAAGAAGVIKTALALQHERLPASINFSRLNPKIDFEGSPFVVQAMRAAWPRGASPRRAGVSSFGVGGTNAHVVLEEAPLPAPRAAATGPQLLRISARTPTALQAHIGCLADFLERERGVDLGDVAHTLDIGRREFAHRTHVVASDVAAAIVDLRSADGARARARPLPQAEPAVVFAFPGQGVQYAGMGLQMYQRLPDFRAAFDECLGALEGQVGFDAHAVFFGEDGERLAQTEVTQPATFCIEYSIARLWLARGLQPAALVGHSIGEFVAAVLAGVMSLEDAVRLVARRGALMQALPAGSMLSVRLAATELVPLLPADVQLAAENGPAASVVAGPSGSIDALAARLESRGTTVRRLVTSHAFHSAMMQPALPAFEAALRDVQLSPPRTRLACTATGRWLSDTEATDPAHWVRQLREPVRFSPAVTLLLRELRAPLFVECGPRATLCALIRQHRQGQVVPQAVASLADDPASELGKLADAAGALWSRGAAVHWPAPAAQERRRIVLPTYAFERQRYWVDAVAASPGLSPASAIAPQPSVTADPLAPDVASALPKPMAHPTTSVSSSASLLIETPTNTMTATTQAAGRLSALNQRLRGVFEDVSGYELADADGAAGFVELGLDSLTLTQVAMQLKREFSLNITFRQLMEAYRSFDALAAHLDATLPADAVAAAPAPASAATTPSMAVGGAAPPAATALSSMALPHFAAAAAGSPLVQQVIQQQMLLMAQQLALLQGQPASAMLAPVAIAATVSVPSQVTPSTAAAPAAQAAPAAPAAGAALADEEGAIAHRTYDVKKAFGAIARIHTSGTEISERQRARLESFMRRYIQKTQRSKAYTVQHRPHLADPRVVNGFRPLLKEIIYQIVIERSKGSRLWDLDGNEYVDALNGFGMSLFGWQPDFVLEAVRRQLDGGYDIGPQHPLAGEVAQLMCKLTGFDRAGLCNTGSEAVMGCVRIARTVTGRSKIAIFAGAYHGIFDEVIVRGTKKLKSVPAAPGILPNTAENVVVLDYGTPETLQWLKDNAKDLAAVLVEPVQSRRPDFQPRDFLRELRTLTEQAGALLIFDEVVTGFRCHPGGIQALFGIRADLGSYGKVVGGGFPIGIIAGKREYMDALDGGHWEFGDDSIPTVGVTYFAGTFVRHPLALVAAKAVLEHLDREGADLQATLTRSTAAMVDELNAHCREVGAPIVLKHFSSVWKVFFNEDHPLQDLLFAMMRNRGVHILDNFPCFMTTAHTAQDIAIIKTAFKEAVAELQEADFLPRRVSAAKVEFDASRPPVPGARLGRDAEGKPAWFVANPQAPGKYIKVDVQ